MARVETPKDTPSASDAPDEEHLDEWFARRLESQGIPAHFGTPSLSRVTAVVGLVLALGGLLWALSSVGPKQSASATTPPGTTKGGHSNSTGGNKHPTGGKVTWRTVTVDVLNGFGGSGAASTAADSLRTQGWKVGTTGNATGITTTEVVFLPGFKKEAVVVARKLGLGAPVKIADATGVVPSSTTGVAIVLGPDLLPTA